MSKKITIALVKIQPYEAKTIISAFNLIKDRVRYSFELTESVEAADAFIVDVGIQEGRDFFDDMTENTTKPVVGFSSYRGERRLHHLKRPVSVRALENTLNQIGTDLALADAGDISHIKTSNQGSKAGQVSNIKNN